jgi:multidrug resistance efflux pump
MPKLKTVLFTTARFAVTAAVVAAAVVGGRALWTHYQVDPWTRDGRVRADVVQVAPDVSGLVTKVAASNDQTVKAGQPLFYVDRERYALALRQADANVAAARATLSQARRELVRNRPWANWSPPRAPSRARPRSSRPPPPWPRLTPPATSPGSIWTAPRDLLRPPTASCRT